MKKQIESRPAKPSAGADGMMIDVTLRVNDLKPMRKFYEELLGFKLLGELPSAALLRMEGGRDGQMQMLGLLQRSAQIRTKINISSHIVFRLTVPNEVARKRLESLGLTVESMRGAGRKSLRVRDPEGNEVELIGREKGGHD